MSTPRSVRARLIAICVGFGLAASATAVSTVPAYAASAPKHFAASEVAAQAIKLTWSGSSKGAYRLRMSTKRDMSNAQTWDVLGNSYVWTNTNPNPNTSSARLTAGKTYYFQVKSISSNKKSSLSSYSAKISVKTSAKAYQEVKPDGLTATSSTNAVYLSWNSRGPGVRYLVRYSTSHTKKVTRWKQTTVDTAGATISGLSPSTKYYFRVRVLNDAGSPLSAYSGTAKATTKTTSTPLKVLSYNVNKSSNTSHAWEDRRDAVAANILAQTPDVVGLQEASPLTVTGANGGDVTQYDDLLQRLGSPYSLATRRGSSGTKLAYNTDRLTVVEADATALTTLGSATRYAVWAVFRDKLDGTEFFVLNTHLEPGSGAVAEYNQARATQAEEVLALVSAHSGGRPVMIIGDMNSARTADVNAPYLAFTAAGLVDPTDNARASWTSGRDATAEHLVNTEYNSFNGYETQARRTSFAAGTYIDYVFTDPDIRVIQFETVVDLDRNGDFVGTIPSDHNAIVATISLP